MIFGVFLGPKIRQKSLKKHSLGHSEAGAQNHLKSTPWGTFRPEPRGTPVNGGRDRKVNDCKFNTNSYASKHRGEFQKLFPIQTQCLQNGGFYEII